MFCVRTVNHHATNTLVKVTICCVVISAFHRATTTRKQQRNPIVFVNKLTRIWTSMALPKYYFYVI